MSPATANRRRPLEDVFGKKHTTHITAADSDGNWVAITATVNTTFGSKVIVPGTGIVLNNEMDDFSAQPRQAERLRAGRRQRTTSSPGKRPPVEHDADNRAEGWQAGDDRRRRRRAEDHHVGAAGDLAAARF